MNTNKSFLFHQHWENKGMLGLYISLGVAFFLVAVLLVVTYVIYRMAFYNDMKEHPNWEPMGSKSHLRWQKESKAMIEEARAIPHQEDLFINSYDGCKLHAALYLSEVNTNTFAIECHGYKDPAVKDFSGGLGLALSKNQNVLLIDHRGHGQSGGRTISFGIKEQYDVLAWIDYLNKRFNNPKILLYGISMGASTVLLVSGHDLPANVLGIVADCGYSSAKEEVLYTSDKMGISRVFAYPALFLGALIYGHFDLRKGEVTEAVKRSTKPILIVHGTDDTTVPFKCAEEIYHSNEEKITLVPFEGAPHGYSWMADYKKYMEAIDDFYKKNGIE